MTVRPDISAAQAWRLANIWTASRYGGSRLAGWICVGGYVDSTDAAILRRGWLAPTGRRKEAAAGPLYEHELSSAGFAALAEFFKQEAKNERQRKEAGAQGDGT